MDGYVTANVARWHEAKMEVSLRRVLYMGISMIKFIIYCRMVVADHNPEDLQQLTRFVAEGVC